TRPQGEHGHGPDMVPAGYVGFWEGLQAANIPFLGLRDNPWSFDENLMAREFDECYVEPKTRLAVAWRASACTPRWIRQQRSSRTLTICTPSTHRIGSAMQNGAQQLLATPWSTAICTISPTLLQTPRCHCLRITSARLWTVRRFQNPVSQASIPSHCQHRKNNHFQAV